MDLPRRREEERESASCLLTAVNTEGTPGVIFLARSTLPQPLVNGNTPSMPAPFIPIILEFALIGVMALLFWLIVARVINRERAERKPPFTKTLLKGPGESCLRKLDELNDKYLEWQTMILVGFGVIVAFAPWLVCHQNVQGRGEPRRAQSGNASFMGSEFAFGVHVHVTGESHSRVFGEARLYCGVSSPHYPGSPLTRSLSSSLTTGLSRTAARMRSNRSAGRSG